jgi:long-chain acyl-CoA synthetase
MGQPVGVVMLSPEAAGHSGTAAERAELSTQLSAHLDSINAKLDPHEQLDCLVVIKTPWTVDNGFITPTFKIKRNRVEEVYGPQLEGWVGERKKVVFGD